jgi:sec-independent protein translocase protein TatB
MLSIPHLVIIFVIALIVLGPEKLPQVARVLGKAMADFRRVTTDFRVQIEDEMRDMERQTRVQQMTAEPSPYRPTDAELLGATLTPAETPPPPDSFTSGAAEPATSAPATVATLETVSPEATADPAPATAPTAAPEKPADGNPQPA